MYQGNCALSIESHWEKPAANDETVSAKLITSDPIGLGGGLNTYGYVGGNPIKYFDSKGLLSECIDKIFKRYVERWNKPETEIFGTETLVIPVPTGGGPGINLDPRYPRRIPIVPVITVEYWRIEVSRGRKRNVRMMKQIEEGIKKCKYTTCDPVTGESRIIEIESDIYREHKPFRENVGEWEYFYFRSRLINKY